MAVLDTTLLDRIMAEMPPTIIYYVADRTAYGIYQELGTTKMAAQPHVTPVVESHRANDTIGQALKIYGLLGVDKALRATAFTIVGDIYPMAPFDLGQLRNSYHVTKERP